MVPEIKFCGITRREDAAVGLDLGADYLGLILAPSRRRVSVTQASELVTFTGSERVPWVGVFTEADVHYVTAAVRTIGLRVVQMHVSVPAGFARKIVEATGARVWCVAGVGEGRVEAPGPDAVIGVETLLFDAVREGRSGGLGKVFDWDLARDAIESWRGRVRVAVAGGLSPDNVGDAVRVLAPDIVDVSSGVESAPGIKDHDRMREFVSELRGARQS